MENSIFLKPSLSGYNRWQVSCSAPSQWTGLGTSQPCWTEPETSSRCPPPRTRDWRAESGLRDQCQRWTSSLQHSRSQLCSLGPRISLYEIFDSLQLYMSTCAAEQKRIFLWQCIFKNKMFKVKTNFIFLSILSGQQIISIDWIFDGVRFEEFTLSMVLNTCPISPHITLFMAFIFSGLFSSTLITWSEGFITVTALKSA